MHAFTIQELITRQVLRQDRYVEFLRVPALSAGLYLLPTGGTDPQLPHTEDEVYYIVSGRAVLRVDDEDQQVGAGSLVFVAANVVHRFHSISEDLCVLVFFAPAEETLARADQER